MMRFHEHTHADSRSGRPRFRALAGIFVALCLAVTGLTMQSAQAADTGSITGHVFTKDVGGAEEPVSGGYLYYYFSADGKDYSSAIGKSFEGPDFTLDGLASGYYKFEVAGTDPDGYQREFYNDGYNLDDATAIKIGDGQAVTADDVVVEKPGQISGTVTGTDGKPLANASVFFERPGDGGAFGVQTDDQGRYSSTNVFSGGLVKGDYYVNVDKYPDNDHPDDPSYARTYWPNSPTQSGANRVSVVPGQSTDSIDFSLPVSPRIKLTVEDPQGKPLANLPVGIYLPNDNGVWGPIQSGPHETDANGVYRMDTPVGSQFKFKIDPPEGLAGAVSQWYDNAYNIDDATPVKITQQSEHINLTIQLGPRPTVQAGTPAISGTPQVGKTLTASPGTWGPAGVKLTYQWLVGGSAVTGATNSTYVPTASDVGKVLTVTVTGSMADHASASATSAPTTAVAAAPAQTSPLSGWLNDLINWLLGLFR